MDTPRLPRPYSHGVFAFCGRQGYDLFMLSDKHWKFTIEYCVDFNATMAAIRAGYSEDTAGQIGHELLKRPDICAAVEERKATIALTAQLNPQWILERWMEIARGDPADLSRAERVNCRHCHGYDHAYQWTEHEYRKSLDDAILAGKAAPECPGGLDFHPLQKPHPDCRECGGQGVERVYIADVREVTGHGRKLFAGIKMTSNGPEIKLRDQDAALKNLASYLGMSLERKEVSGPGGGPIPTANLTSKDFTDEQLEALVAGNANET